MGFVAGVLMWNVGSSIDFVSWNLVQGPVQRGMCWLYGATQSWLRTIHRWISVFRIREPRVDGSTLRPWNWSANQALSIKFEHQSPMIVCQFLVHLLAWYAAGSFDNLLTFCSPGISVWGVNCWSWLASLTDALDGCCLVQEKPSTLPTMGQVQCVQCCCCRERESDP